MKTLFLILISVLLPLVSSAYNPPPIGGGVNADCVRLGCLHGLCNLDADMEKVTQACIGVEDNSCMHTFCNRHSDCDFMDSFRRYADLCAGRNPDGDPSL